MLYLVSGLCPLFCCFWRTMPCWFIKHLQYLTGYLLLFLLKKIKKIKSFELLAQLKVMMKTLYKYTQIQCVFRGVFIKILVGNDDFLLFCDSINNFNERALTFCHTMLSRNLNYFIGLYITITTALKRLGWLYVISGIWIWRNRQI